LPESGGQIVNRHAARHSAEASEPAAARHAEQHGLSLIIESMGCDNAPGLGAMGRNAQQPVARHPRRFLNAGRRFRAAPPHDAMFDAKLLCEAFYGSCFVPGFGPQAMIDRHREETRGRPPRCAPARHEIKQRRRIGTAGNREYESRLGNEIGEQCVGLGFADSSVNSGHAFVPARPPA
jgi:hypothetical protein